MHLHKFKPSSNLICVILLEIPLTCHRPIRSPALLRINKRSIVFAIRINGFDIMKFIKSRVYVIDIEKIPFCRRNVKYFDIHWSSFRLEKCQSSSHKFSIVEMCTLRAQYMSICHRFSIIARIYSKIVD